MTPLYEGMEEYMKKVAIPNNGDRPNVQREIVRSTLRRQGAGEERQEPLAARQARW